MFYKKNSLKYNKLCFVKNVFFYFRIIQNLKILNFLHIPSPSYLAGDFFISIKIYSMALYLSEANNKYIETRRVKKIGIIKRIGGKFEFCYSTKC